MKSLLQQLTKELEPISETASLDAQVLLAHITQKPKSWILSHPELLLTPEQKKALEKSLENLKKYVPLPYVVGHWEFFGLDFIVSSDVLIPRPETEELVEIALDWLRDRQDAQGLDMGTGSGCISISLARNAPNIHLVAVDRSPTALNIARQNAAKHSLAERIIFIESDLFANLQPSTFDLITANLPYIPTETLKTLDVYNREPTLALDGGADGLSLIRRFLADTRKFIAPNGLMLLEIDSSHGPKALELGEEYFPKAKAELIKDLSDRDRFIRIQT